LNQLTTVYGQLAAGPVDRNSPLASLKSNLINVNSNSNLSNFDHSSFDHSNPITSNCNHIKQKDLKDTHLADAKEEKDKSDNLNKSMISKHAYNSVHFKSESCARVDKTTQLFSSIKLTKAANEKEIYEDNDSKEENSRASHLNPIVSMIVPLDPNEFIETQSVLISNQNQINQSSFPSPSYTSSSFITAINTSTQNTNTTTTINNTITSITTSISSCTFTNSTTPTSYITTCITNSTATNTLSPSSSSTSSLSSSSSCLSSPCSASSFTQVNSQINNLVNDKTNKNHKLNQQDKSSYHQISEIKASDVNEKEMIIFSKTFKIKENQCPMCKQKFTQTNSLKRHIRSHTGEKPFPCSYCGKRFIDKERLKVHIRIHTGEKPFSCSRCGRRFSQKSTVKRHMSVHTGEKPFQCITCGKGFASRDNLKVHEKSHYQFDLKIKGLSSSLD